MNQGHFIQIDETDRRKIAAMLSDIKDAGARVAMRAINKTLTGVRTDASAEICKVINVKKEAVDKTFKISRATMSNPSAYISSTGSPISLINFKGTRQTAKGVSVQVRKDKSRKVIDDAFIATMKSGHKGVFWREWHERRGVRMNKTESAINRSGYVWSQTLRRYISIAWLPREYRLPLEELSAPRIQDYIQDGPLLTRIMAKAGDRLHKNLMHETDYELSKHK